jgi:GNAT superfamily N-acetyltransferase
MEGLVALTSAVFHPSLVKDFPHFFIPENASNLRVVVENGRVVSHIGTLRRDASLMGCTVKTAALGGVATYEEHRGKGHATALLEDTMQVCRQDGVDFMLVSGYRKMYHRFGCRFVGRDWRFKIEAAQAGDFDDGVEISLATEADLPVLSDLYRREPVRWIRPPSDFRNALGGKVLNRPSVIHVLKVNGIASAYVIVRDEKKEEADEGQVLEMAGDRGVLAGSFGKLIGMYGSTSLSLHVMGSDGLLQGILKERGAASTPTAASGTVTLIHFEQFMDRMRPYFTEVVGEDIARGLVFEQVGDQRVFRLGRDVVVADNQGQAVELIFGTHEGVEERLLGGGGKAGEVLREVFPIPALWYGLNFV